MRERRTVAMLSLTACLFLLSSGCHGLFIRPKFDAYDRTIESGRLSIRTDLPPEAVESMLAAGEQMLDELEAWLPSAEDSRNDVRKVIAFSNPEGFRAYLASHMFSQERAIGFFCELGHECALVWGEPTAPEDFRVLRHELTHQHLARVLNGSLPPWLEEGLAERVALAPLKGVSVSDGDESRWPGYCKHRGAVDAVFAALALRPGRSSWPDQRQEPATSVPPPSWGAGENGYVLHLLFIQFLERIGEGLDGALGQALAHAADGQDATLDLSRRFKTLGEVDDQFLEFVHGQGLRAVTADARSEDSDARSQAYISLFRIGYLDLK